MSEDYGMTYLTEEQRLGIEPVGLGFDLPANVVSTNGVVDHEGFADEPQDDDGWGNAFDLAEIEAAIKVDLPPEGVYVGLGLILEDRVNPFNQQREIACYGRAVNAEGRVAKVRFELLPRKLYKKDDSGKLVWNHVLFKQAVLAYQKARESLPTSADDFKEYLSTASLEYRLVHNQKRTGMKVMNISHVMSEVSF